MSYLAIIERSALAAHLDIALMARKRQDVIKERFAALVRGTRAEPYYHAYSAWLNRSNGQKRRFAPQRQQGEMK